MDFKEELQQLSHQISKRKNHVNNEETTKQALIIPFIQLLGYDVYNPLEVRPEYVSDFAKKKGEKVDYAIFNESNEPTIFVEAKSINENLEKHSPQLARYFNATHELKLAIITNGIEYHFFTDLKVINVMDDTPFFQFNIITLSDDNIEILDSFRKHHFNNKFMLELAEELVYSNDLDKLLIRLLKEPPDEFIRFVLKGIMSTRITSVAIDKFRPLVKKSTANAIQALATMESNYATVSPNVRTKPPKPKSERQHKPIKNESSETPISVLKQEILEVLPPIEKQTLPLTDIEEKAFDYVNTIITTQFPDVELVSVKELDHFFRIFTADNNLLVELYLHASDMYIVMMFGQDEVAKNIGTIFRQESYNNSPDRTTIYINSIEDLYKIARLFKKCIQK